MTARINLIYLILNIYDYLNNHDSKNIEARMLVFHCMVANVQSRRTWELFDRPAALNWVGSQTINLLQFLRTKGQREVKQVFKLKPGRKLLKFTRGIGEKLERWGRCKNENLIKKNFDLLTQYEAQWSFRKSCNVEMVLANSKLLITILIVSLNRMWYCDS